MWSRVMHTWLQIVVSSFQLLSLLWIDQFDMSVTLPWKRGPHLCPIKTFFYFITSTFQQVLRVSDLHTDAGDVHPWNT
ncbi:hypothetical protein BKA64DRAFT_383580 [Cadophora sp. MPI-SDFR-AT-0126]|nr:hypothetical protein BKA64DRAFT_383580 [Leotiomycetes sp. MPI-SDFR-AT-0126]